MVDRYRKARNLFVAQLAANAGGSVVMMDLPE
jgi:hypothetical protein